MKRNNIDARGTFRVIGVSKLNCRALALSNFSDLILKNPRMAEELIARWTEAYYSSLNMRREPVSPEYTTPEMCEIFIQLATENDEIRHMQIQYLKLSLRRDGVMMRKWWKYV